MKGELPGKGNIDWYLDVSVKNLIFQAEFHTQHIMTTTCSSRNPRNVLIEIIIGFWLAMFGCTISFHRSVAGVNWSKFEPIRQQGWIHRRLLDENFRCEEPEWYDIRIAFQLGAKNFPQKMVPQFWHFCHEKPNPGLTGQLGIVGPTGHWKKAEAKKNGAWWIHTLQGSRTIPSMVMVYLPTFTININHSWTGKDANVPWMVWVNWLSPTATSSNLLSWRFST